MSHDRPPVLEESQSWKSYSEKVIAWLRFTSIAPEKAVGCIIANGIYKHGVLLKLAENLVDEYSEMDRFYWSDFPGRWQHEDGHWSEEMWLENESKYCPGHPQFDAT